MLTLTLSQRLFVVTAVALLPSFLILASSIRVSQAENESSVHREAARTAELVGLEMERLMSGAESVLRVISVTPIVRTGDFETCSALVRDMARTVDSLAAIGVINPDGNLRCSPTSDQSPPTLGDRPYFIEAMATDERVVGTFTVGRVSGDKVLPIALRIGGTAEAPLGVAVAYLDLGWLEARLQERTYIPGSALTIADRNGTILARVPDPERFVGTVIPDAFQHLLTMAEPGTLELTSQDGTRRVVGYQPITTVPLGLYVSAGFPTETAFASTKEITAQGIVIALAGIVAALVLALYTSRVFVARPVQTLITTVEAWRSGNTDARTGMSAANGELEKAGRAFDDFIEDLLVARQARQRADEQRKVLLAELDHRGRNLLTMIQAVARRTFSQSAGEPEMQAFSARLQAMGQANSMLRNENWQSASLALLLRAALTPFVDPSAARVTMSGPPILLHGDVVLPLSMAFHELATNAVKYGALKFDAGTLSVDWSLTPTPEGDVLELIWREHGGPPVVAPQKRGFGSTIIQQVLASHTDGEVSLTFDPDGLFCRITIGAEKLIGQPSKMSAAE